MSLFTFSFIIVFLPGLLLATKYNYTCKFKLPDNEIYDLHSLRNNRPPDYTYKEGDYLFVINLCGPSIKRCAGIEKSFVSIWNSTTYDCITTAGENDPIATYLDNRNVFKGIKLTYPAEMSSTNIEIACDQAYDKAVLVKAERKTGEYNFYFKSKLVCRNYAVPATDKWSSTAVFLVLMLIGILAYVGCGVCISMRKGSYTSFSDVLPQKECALKIMLKMKEWVNGVARPINTSTEGSEMTQVHP